MFFNHWIYGSHHQGYYLTIAPSRADVHLWFISIWYMYLYFIRKYIKLYGLHFWTSASFSGHMTGNQKIESWAIVQINVWCHHMEFQNNRLSNYGEDPNSSCESKTHFRVTCSVIKKIRNWGIVKTNVWYHHVSFKIIGQVMKENPGKTKS